MLTLNWGFTKLRSGPCLGQLVNLSADWVVVFKGCKASYKTCLSAENSAETSQTLIRVTLFLLVLQRPHGT